MADVTSSSVPIVDEPRELDVLRDEVADLRVKLTACEQTSGDLCPTCGWRGIRGGDPCAFCSLTVNVEKLRSVVRDELSDAKLGMLDAEKTRADAAEAKLAACEVEREEFRRLVERGEGRVKEIVDEKLTRDLGLARAEAERLRGALTYLNNLQVTILGGQDVAGNALTFSGPLRKLLHARSPGALAVVDAALSTASPAAPSAALSSEYRRAREAVEFLRTADSRLVGLATRPGEAHDVGLFVQHQVRAAIDALLAVSPSSEYRRGYERAVEDAVSVVEDAACSNEDGNGPCEGTAPLVAAIRSLLPAPRAVGEAEVERMVAVLMRLFPSLMLTMDSWRGSARAVLAAQGEGSWK